LSKEGHHILVLTRRDGESVIIAGDIRITVVSIGPGRVKLGIEAPPHTRVDRQEIYDKLNLPSSLESLDRRESVPLVVEAPAEQPRSFRLVIEAYADHQIDPVEVAERLVGLYEKLDEYCRLKYGRGLTLKEFEQHVRVGSRVPVGG
jgi:carbon storage regulator CsrA